MHIKIIAIYLCLQISYGLLGAMPEGLGPAHCGGMYGQHVWQAMSHMLTRYCSAQAAADSGLTAHL